MCQQQARLTAEAVETALAEEHRRQRVELEGWLAQAAVDGSEPEGERDETAALDAESGADAGAAGVSDAAAEAAERDACVAARAIESGGSVYKRARVADIVEMFGGRGVRQGGVAAGADVAAGGGGASSPGASGENADAYGGGEAAGTQGGAAVSATEVAEEHDGEELHPVESTAPQEATVVGGAGDVPIEDAVEQEQAAGAVAVEPVQPTAGVETSADEWVPARSRRAARRQREQLPQPPPSSSRGDTRRHAELSEHAVPGQHAESGETAASERAESSNYEDWFSSLGEVVEEVAGGGPAAGISRAACLMHLGAAEDVPRKVGLDFRGRTVLLTLNGDLVVAGEGQARQSEDANMDSKIELAVQIVRFMGGRIDKELGREGFSEGERQAVASFVSVQASLVQHMAVKDTADARWRVLHEAMARLTEAADDDAS